MLQADTQREESELARETERRETEGEREGRRKSSIVWHMSVCMSW